MSLRVLVVDDHTDVVEMVAILIEQWGHRCEVAQTGHEALEIALQFEPDVALLDIGLPDISGYDVAQALRARCGGIVLAAVTGWGKPEDRERAFAAGFDRHILKPATRAAIREVLASAERRREFDPRHRSVDSPST